MNKQEINTVKEIKRITVELEKRVRKYKKGINCPVCNYESFSMGPYYTLKMGANKVEVGSSLTNASLPAISIICENCGYIMDFSLGRLGFFPKKGKKRVKNGKKKK